MVHGRWEWLAIAACLVAAGCSDDETTGPNGTAGSGGGVAGSGGSAAGGSGGGGAAGGGGGGAGGGSSAERAGHFETTPFPIDEGTTSYSVDNDDGSQSFELGTKLYVDGASGADQGDCQSSATPCLSIAYAIEQAPAGNTTILVRGAHDGFDGIYAETGLNPKAGTDHGHRWSLVGYGQERPIIDAGGAAGDIIGSTGQPEAYVTVQRFELQNSQGRCVRLGNGNEKRDGHFALIDLWAHDCTNQPGNDGNIYYLNADDGWIHHVTTEHTYGHCLKIGDGADDPVVEWTVARECGYWAGFPHTSYYGNHAAGFDFPNDAGADSANVVLRHSVVHDVLFYGIQLRRAPGFLAYGNEIHSAARCWHHMSDPAAECDSHSLGPYQILLYAGATSGHFHSNLVRDPGASVASHLRVTACDSGAPAIAIYNNLFYGMGGAALAIAGNNAGATLQIMNNSVHGDSATALLESYQPTGLELVNNAMVQAGAGSCLSVAAADHHHNILHAPQGSAGIPLDPTELSADPQWLATPADEHDPDECAIGSGSPAADAGTDLSGLFTSSFNGVPRPQGAGWDIGAYEAPE